MSKEEFLAKYGNIKVKFISYFKYVFVFRGYTDSGVMVIVHVGGCSEDIYRQEVTADRLVEINTLDPSEGYSVNQQGLYVDNFTEG